MIKKAVIVEIIVVLFLFFICIIQSNSDLINIGSNNIINKDIHVKKVALTFDDGPGEYTEELINELKKRDVKATFFMIGESIEQYPELVKRMSNEGHVIGNHTYTHIHLTSVSNKMAMEEITKTNDIIKGLTGSEPEYIRPPYGSLSKKMKKTINMTPVLWDVDPRDWSILNTDRVVCHVIKNVEDGDVILLHDIFDTSVDAAVKIVDILEKEGYIFVTVDELPKYKRYN